MAGGVFVGSVYATMELQTGGFAGDIARAQTQLKGFDQAQNQSAKASEGWASTANKSFSSIGDGLQSLATKLSIVGLAGGALGGVFVKSAADLQQSAKSMEVLTGSTETANKLFSQLAVYANSTPFEFPNIAKGAQVMLGFGVRAEDVFGHIKTLGDIAAATGADFESLSLVFGQVNATGKLMGQDALQLINNKVPITTILAKKLGKSVQDVRADMEDGKISAQIFNEALTDVTKQGGFAFKGVDVLAQSFNGRMSTLKDTVMEFGRNLIGVKVDDKLGLQIQKGGIFDQLSDAIPRVIEGLQKITPNIQAAFAWLLQQGPTIIAIVAGFGAALVAAKVGAFATAMATAVVQFGVMSGIIKGATAAQWGFNVAMSANPIGAIITGVVALIGVLVFLQVKFDIFGKAIRAITPLVSGLWNAIKLIATGDFQGGIFGLEEDHPVIGALITIHEVLENVYNFVKDNFIAAFNSLKSAFDTIGKALKPFIDPLVEFYKKHAPTINKVLIGIGVAIAVLASPILGIIAAFAALIAVVVVVSTVIRVVAKVFEVIVDTVKNVANAIKTYFVDTFTKAKNDVTTTSNVIQSVFGAIGSFIGGVFQNIANFYNTYFKPVFDGIAYVVNAVFTVVSTVFTAIGTIIFTVVSTIVQIIGVVLYGSFMWLMNNVLAPLGAFFATVWNNIVNAVTTAVNAVWGVISTVFGAVWSFVSTVASNIWNAIVQFFTPIVGFVSGIFNSVFSTISSVFNRVWSTVSNIASNIFNTVRNTFNNVTNAMRDGIQGGLNAVTGFVGSFLNAGKNIIDGIVKGVSNGASAVTNKIKEICSGALDAVKNFFGIKSPSRVMAKMGGYLMSGFANGVDDTASLMERSMYKASEMAQDAFNPNVSLTGQYDYRRIANAGYDAFTANGAGGNTTTQIYGNINVDKEVDGDRFLTRVGVQREGVLVSKDMAV